MDTSCPTRRSSDLALAEAWKIHFRTCRTEGLSVVDADGNLDISWPETTNGTPADMDVILATATKPITVPPRAHSVADAWLSQSGGYERSFLENVRHGIRDRKSPRLNFSH